MMRIGMLGTGRMGGPIRRRLLDAGYGVTWFDPADAASAASAVEVASGVDVLITVLPGPTQLDAALTGPDGALAAMPAGAIWVDLTSGDPRVSQRLAAAAAAHGIRSVGAPMGGGPANAVAGSLTFFVDGDPGAVHAVRPILAELGEVRELGPDAGRGQIAKLLANLLWFGQAAAVTEALLLGQALGFEPAALRDVLAASAGGSRFLEGSTDALFRGDYLASFALRRCLEELETLESLARETGSPFTLSTDVTDLYRDALAEFGEVDGELMVAKLLERRAGRLLRNSPETPGG